MQKLQNDKYVHHLIKGFSKGTKCKVRGESMVVGEGYST
jgi:hypothetical protein